MFAPILETPRLVLRHIGPDDAAFVLAHFGDPEVTRLLVDEDPVTTPEEAREIIDFYAEPARLHRNRWVITEREGGAAIGTVGFHLYDERNRRIEIGYDLSPAWQGRGLASEAVGAALDHAFDDLGIHRVEAVVHVRNAPSIRLLERLGFRREGTLRDRYLADGVWHDHHLYAAIATDR